MNSGRTLFHVGRLLTFDAQRSKVEECTVEVVGERIAAIHEGFVSSAGEHEVIDAKTSLMMPGLIDGHVHLAFRPHSSNADIVDFVTNSPREELVAEARRNAQAALAAGITTLRDCGDREFVTLEVRNEIADGAIEGPRLQVAGVPITSEDGHLHFCGGAIGGAVGVSRLLDELQRRNVDVYKLILSGGLMTPGSKPEKVQLSEGVVREVVERARIAGRRTAAHVLSRDSISRAITCGVDTLEHCVWLSGPSEENFDLQMVDLIAKSNVYWSNTLTGIYRALLTGSETELANRDTLLRWLEHFRVMYRAGVMMFITSDAGVIDTPIERFVDSLLVAVEFMGLTPEEAIGAATITPAEALGVSDERGSIEAGKLADFLLVEGDPLNDLASLRLPARVYKGGRLVAAAGELVGSAEFSVRSATS